MAHFGELQVPSTQANTWKKMQSHINEQRVSSKLMKIVSSTETTEKKKILIIDLRFSPFLQLIWMTRKCCALSVITQNHTPVYKHHSLSEIAHTPVAPQTLTFVTILF